MAKNGNKATIREVYDLVNAQNEKREDMERRLIEAMNAAVSGLSKKEDVATVKKWVVGISGFFILTHLQVIQQYVEAAWKWVLTL